MLPCWYYLHENGELICKKDLDGIVQDFRESDFVRAFWQIRDESSREDAWTILVEAMALKSDKERLKQLAKKWDCDDEDAQIYARRVGVKLFIDGDTKCAAKTGFIDLQSSPCGFGETYLEAMADLCHRLGFKDGKMWNKTFAQLLQEWL